MKTPRGNKYARQTYSSIILVYGLLGSLFEIIVSKTSSVIVIDLGWQRFEILFISVLPGVSGREES